jgi:hypothetical protein
VSAQFLNRISGVSVTTKGLVIIVFELGKRIDVYRIHEFASHQPVPIMTIDHRVMAFWGINYFAPVLSKVSIYHDEVVFVQTKTGVMAININ